MAKSFAQNLRYFRANFFFANFCAWNAMSFALFFAQFAQNRKYFLRKLRMKWNFGFAQNRKFYEKCNFLGKLSKIDTLSLELNNWRFIPYIKKNINIRV